MKIKFIKEQDLHVFRNSCTPILNYVRTNNDSKWIQTIISLSPFSNTKLEVPELNFVIDPSRDPIDTDFENAVMLYEALRHLNETQATDERLWVGIELNEGYDYMMYRWGLDDETKFTYRWTFFTTGKRGLLYHGLARLWWFAKLTYDPSREDHYELTRFGFSKQSILLKLFYRNYSNSTRIVRAILSELMEFDKKYVLTYAHTVELYKAVSLMGSVSLIDAFEADELAIKIRQSLATIKDQIQTKVRNEGDV